MNDHTSRLIIDVVRLLAAGKISPSNAIPTLRELTAEESDPIPCDFLLDAISRQGGAQASRLIADLRACRRRDAARLHTQRAQGTVHEDEFRLTLAGLPRQTPLQWTTPGDAIGPLADAMRVARDRRFIRRAGNVVPVATRLLQQRYQYAVDACSEELRRFAREIVASFRGPSGSELPDGLDEDTLQQLHALAADDARQFDRSRAAESIARDYRSADLRPERQEFLDALCSLEGIEAAQVIADTVVDARDCERAELILITRFGSRAAAGWAGMQSWLGRCERQRLDEVDALRRMFRQAPGEFLALWLSSLPHCSSELLERVTSYCDQHVKDVRLDELLARYGAEIPATEWQSLQVLAESPPPAPRSAAAAATTPPTDDEILDDSLIEIVESPAETASADLPDADSSAGEAPRGEPLTADTQQSLRTDQHRLPQPEPVVSGPSLWSDHIQPFLTEQWYLAAGVLMVLVGSSLLAYYTWDKHWAIRYTLMPSMLGLFTWALTWLGDWVERRDEEFTSTAAVLRASAIGLLPINFMAVALLSNDPQVGYKGLAIPLMATVYLLVFGYGLRRWCGAVCSRLSWLLGGTLLGLNSLVMIGPLARVLPVFADGTLRLLIAAGFYAGFAAAAWAVIQFPREVMKPASSGQQRVSWFFGATLTVTFAQVMFWVYGYLRQVPDATTYSAMVILTGGLVLYVERCVQALDSRSSVVRGESFLGFALILLGLLMGLSSPWGRVAAFLLGGAVWLSHGPSPSSRLHDWIGLTLLTLGGASVGLVSGFPRQHLPAVGIGLAISVGLGARGASRAGHASLRDTCRDMQAVILMLTAVVAVLVQWEFRTPPLWTGGWLLVVVAGFFWRAWYDGRIRWVHSAMAVLAIALPYLGCVDFERRTLQGNVVPFGLAAVSIIWLGLTHVARRLKPVTVEPASTEPPASADQQIVSFPALILGARSTVLWIYGALAVAAMVLRVIVEADRAPVTGMHMAMDYAGPLLMSAVLVAGTWYARSLIPAIMAATIVIILFPEIRATFSDQFEALGWGTGLGSALSALGLIAAAFLLRPAAFLRSPGEGDLFLNRIPFPLRRTDHTLFTWPLMGSAAFLVIRTGSVTMVQNLADGMELRFGLSVLVTAAAWLLAAGYLRRLPKAGLLCWIGGGYLTAAVFLLFRIEAPDLLWCWPMLVAGLTLQCLFAAGQWVLRAAQRPGDVQGLPAGETGGRSYLSRVTGAGTDRSWIRSIYTDPLRAMLHAGTLALVGLCGWQLVVSAPPPVLIALTVFVLMQLCWHGLRADQFAYGAFVFALGWLGLLSWMAPGAGHLLDRISYETVFAPTLILLYVIQCGITLLDLYPDIYRQLRAITGPLQLLASGLAAAAILWGLLEAVFAGTPGAPTGALLLRHLAVVAGLGLLTARVQVSTACLSAVMLLGYAMAHADVVEVMGVVGQDALQERMTAFLSPWRLALLALVYAFVELLFARMSTGWRHVVTGRYPQLLFRAHHRGWLIVPCLLAGIAATMSHTVDAFFREQTVQLVAPFLAAAAWGVVGWSTRQAAFYLGSGVLIAIGNIHVVRVFLGDTLRPYGVSELQLVCLGLAFSLLELTLIRLAARNAVMTRAFNRASLGLAGMVMALIGVNYVAHPDLATITWQRFAISGSMAWLAGLYFRRAARRPMAGEESSVRVAEGMHHLGLTVALWCAVLMIPAMRQPGIALMSLGVPLAWFWLRSEPFLGGSESTRFAYRDSAAVLSFALQFAYVFRFAFQMVMFPAESVIDLTTPLSELLHTDYYHSSAPFLFVVSVLLLRLNGLGATAWTAVYGGLGLVVTSFFLLTWLPGLSPFDSTTAAAWCGIGLAHFWALLSDQRSPIRTVVLRMADIDARRWFELRRIWGLFTLAASHVLVVVAMRQWQVEPRMMAPLLAGVATVILHQGIIRGSAVYLTIAGVELLLALHADFVVDSYIDRARIVWVVFGIWTGLLIARSVVQTVRPGVRLPAFGTVAAGFASIAFAHVMYHRPWSVVGLWAAFVMTVLGLLTPRPSRQAVHGEDRLAAALPALAPAWLVFFSQVDLPDAGVAAWLRSWPLLTTTLTVLLTGGFAVVFQRLLAPAYNSISRPQPRLADQTLCWLASDGELIHLSSLSVCFLTTALAQVSHHGRAFGNAELGIILVLYAVMAIAWYRQGQTRRNMVCYVLLQLSVVGFFAVGRRQLMLTTDVWTPQYDVWASLIVSALLTGFKQYFDVSPREVRIPLLGTLFGLPVVALVWVLWNDLGTDVAMLVVGLHSLMFAFLGKDDRESPYNLVATFGFVAFVLMLFWTRLELRVIHAYTIPVGLGVLTMLHLLRDHVNPDTRNRVRLVTLLTMIGSVGYYALLDTRYPVAFHVTMLAVCMAAMALGTLLRVRLYMVCGFTGLVVDLASIVYRAVAGIEERGTQMTIVGSLVLVTGIGLVLGAIYYKTHRDQVNQRLDRFSGAFGSWE